MIKQVKSLKNIFESYFLDFLDLEESVKGSDFIFDYEDLSHKKQIS